MQLAAGWTDDVICRVNDVIGKPDSSSAAAAAGEATERRQYGAGENSDSPPSEGQSQGDYQQPMSVGSDLLSSSYNLSFLRDGELRTDDDEEETNCPAAASTDLQCEDDTDGPIYVNTAALAAAAAGDDDDDGGDTAGSDYMHVLDYGADEDADNIYLTAPQLYTHDIVIIIIIIIFFLPAALCWWAKKTTILHDCFVKEEEE